jgi:hypothetical protein
MVSYLKRGLGIIPVLNVCVLLLAGCASMESSLERRWELFEQTTFRFENALRWGQYELANEFIKTGGDDRATPDFDKLRDIKVSSYELLKSTVSPGELQARQTVEIKYYSVNTLIEKTLVYEQLWTYDTQEKRWYLNDEFPDLK